MQRRWSALCGRLGLSRDIEGAFARLADAYSNPPRAYHSMEHVAECLSTLDRVSEGSAEHDLVELALWYHDAVYDATRKDNEARSADLAEAEIAEMRGSGPECRLCADVRRLILATRHVEPPTDGAEALILDVDLSILGAEPTRYDAYATAIRLEYAFVEEAAFQRGRAAFLRGMLARPSLFHTPAAAELFEAAARGNVARELGSLTA